MRADVGVTLRTAHGKYFFDNAYRLDHTIDPIRLVTDPIACTIITVAELNRIMDSRKPPGLREIADARNSGDWRDAVTTSRAVTICGKLDRATCWMETMASASALSSMPAMWPM